MGHSWKTSFWHFSKTLLWGARHSFETLLQDALVRHNQWQRAILWRGESCVASWACHYLACAMLGDFSKWVACPWCFVRSQTWYAMTCLPKKPLTKVSDESLPEVSHNTVVSHKISETAVTRISKKKVPQKCPTRMSHKSVSEEIDLSEGLGLPWKNEVILERLCKSLPAAQNHFQRLTRHVWVSRCTTPGHSHRPSSQTANSWRQLRTQGKATPNPQR